MIIGTDDDDIITTWGPGNEFIDGRGGNDVIEPPIDYNGFSGEIDGGDGIDTLVIRTYAFEGYGDGHDGFISASIHALDAAPNVNIKYRSIERLVIEARNWGGLIDFGTAEVELHTG